MIRSGPTAEVGLGAQHPDVFLPKLAGNLITLGNAQSELGQHEAAMLSTREAINICRKLADQHPDAFLPQLALTLNNLGSRYIDQLQREPALSSMEEATAIYRKLAAQRPDAFLPDLARSLSNVAILLHELERHQEALPLAEESLDMLWPYYERFPAAHGDLIRNMFNLLAALDEKLDMPLDPSMDERVKRYFALSGT